MGLKIHMVEVFEKGNPDDPNRAVMPVLARDGRQAIGKARAYVNSDCGGKFMPAMSFRIVKQLGPVE